MKKTLDFIGKSKIFFGISLTIIIIGIIFNVIFGAKLDIQFKGGAIISYGFVGEIDDAALKDVIQQATPDNQVTFTISQDILSNTEDNDAYTIDIQFSGETAITTDTQQAITDALTENFPENSFEYQETTSVEASMGQNFFLKCIAAIFIASVLMVIYVTIRFRRIGGLSAGVMALVALFHDIAIIYFFYVIFRMPIDSSFIAVVLMILGYSLNDTIVIYDRVREERRIAGPKADLADVFNRSASAVMPRTIATSVTTLVAIGTVYVVATIFGLNSVQSFALPMMIGIISGCYSSLCIAGPLWVIWQKRPVKMPRPKSILALGIVGIICQTSLLFMILGVILSALFQNPILGAFIAISGIVIGIIVSIIGIIRSNLYISMGGSNRGAAKVGRILSIIGVVIGTLSFITDIVLLVIAKS